MEYLIWIFLIPLIAAVYFLPSVIAFYRKADSRWLILLLNLILGGILIGWIGAMIWAVAGKEEGHTSDQKLRAKFDPNDPWGTGRNARRERAPEKSLDELLESSPEKG